MAADLDTIAAEVAEIKAMLQQLLSGGGVIEPEQSPIIETLRAAEALGLDPIQAMEQHRITGSRGRPKRTTTRPTTKRRQHV